MLYRFLKSDRGNFAVITAIALVPIGVAVAGVVDYAATTRDASSLQDTLDLTGLAAAEQYYPGMPQSALEGVGKRIFAANLDLRFSQNTPLEIQNETINNFSATVTGSGRIQNITVSSSIRHPGFVGGMDWTATRQAVVRMTAAQEACVLALNAHVSKALQLQGSTAVDMPGCVLASNSDASDGLYRGGSARVSAKCAISAGGAVGFDSGTTLECDQALTHQYPSFDPLEGVPMPTPGGCATHVPNGKTVTLSPGTFCNENISGNVTLQAGTYVFKGGQLNFNGNGNLTGNGVTLFLTNGATFTANGNAVVNLSPPSSGQYGGITIFQARDNTANLKINGTSGSNVTGYVYAPAASIEFTGNSSTLSRNCIRIVGDTVAMLGNSSVKTDCTTDLAHRLMYVGRSIALVQ